MRRFVVLVGLALAVPVIAARIRERTAASLTGIRRDPTPPTPWRALIIDDVVKPGRSATGPDVWEWYQNHIAETAAKVNMEVHRGTRDYVPGTFAREVDAFPSPDLSSLISDLIAEFEPQAVEVISTACEQAIQTGFMGVKVARGIQVSKTNHTRAERLTNPNADVMFVEAWATVDVPYGYIEDEFGRRRPMGIVGVEDDA